MHLAIDWRFDPEYRFGWFIPVMMAIILVTRFNTNRPSLTANRARLTKSALLFFVGTMALWPAIRIIGIANPDWHLLTWITSLSAITLTLITMHAVGGGKMLRHYGVPFLMVVAVIPWPYLLEQQLIAVLKGANAAIVIEVLHAFGIAAIGEPGGIITIPGAVLGIEEGCTGIRSLHLCLAVALFWGEWFRLSFKGRLALIGLAFGVAIIVNVVRTLSLAMIAHYFDAQTLEQWHDQIGILAQACVVAVCWILTGWIISRKQKWSRARFKNNAKSESASNNAGTAVVRVKGLAFCLAAIWILGSEAGARYWFARGGESETAVSRHKWKWSLPPDIKGIEQQKLPRQWMSLLAADHGFAGRWIDEGQRRVRYLYSFHWQEGRPAALFATHHRPEDCLPASGFEMAGEPERVSFEINRSHPFELNCYTFQSKDGIPLTVFHGTYADESFIESLAGGLTRTRRLERAMQGEGFPETRLLEIIFWDTEKGVAQAEMQKLIGKIVTTSPD